MKRKIINKLIKLNKETKKVVEHFGYISDKYKDYIHPGEWRLHYLGKYVWVCSSNSGKECMNVLESGIYTADLIKIKVKNLIIRFWNNNFYYSNHYCCSQNMKADCIMFSARGDYYFYFWKEQIVKKLYSENVNYVKYLELKKNGYWEFFNTPIIYADDKCMIEKFIRTQKPGTNDKEKFKYVLKRYLMYLKTAQITNEKAVHEILEEYQIKDLDISFPKEFLSVKIKYYYQHGDLWTGNLLQDCEKNYYVIDCDHAGSYPFFFDMFEFIWAVYINDGKMPYWNEILGGKSELALLTDEIFSYHGIGMDNETKIAIMTLMGIIRHTIYCKRFESSQGYENMEYKKKSYYRLSYFIRQYGGKEFKWL